MAQHTSPFNLTEPLDGSSYMCRENLQDILARELLGPAQGDDELLETRPQNKYILGRIAPVRVGLDEEEAARQNSDDQDSEDIDNAQTAGPDGEDGDTAPRRGLMIPSSMGLRFQVSDDLDVFTVHCSWARYENKKVEVQGEDGRETSKTHYQRVPMEGAVRIPLSDLRDGVTTSFPVQDHVVLRVDRYDDSDLKRCLIEIALCNDMESEKPVPTAKWMFQTLLNVDADGRAVFLPVHDWNEDASFEEEPDYEQRCLRLQYRNRLEFAVGRTCSADWTVAPEHPRRATNVRTTWLPTADIPQTEARMVEGVELDMTKLATMDGDQLRAALSPIATEYATWLNEQEASIDALPRHLQRTARDVVGTARLVARQLQDGIDFLCNDAEAQRCFHFMNTVMAEQRVHTQISALRANDEILSIDEARAKALDSQYPHHWRMFQLAFILMQIHALTEPHIAERSGEGVAAQAQLLFFPTGGGKTEAYLGLAAYSFAIRRRQGMIGEGADRLDGSAGVTVLMRYTLRLLTSQQFQRASTLVCAAELERRKDPKTWGEAPFRIGLWVGTSVTPKRVEEAREEIRKSYQRANTNPSVLQIMACPWCGNALTGADVKVDLTAGRVYIHCSDKRGTCPFTEGGPVEEGIPVLMTDEEIYRLVPAFVIATVDKFARLAREGMASSLFGYVGRKCDRHGYVPKLDKLGKSDFRSCEIQDDSQHKAAKGHPAAYIHPATRLRPPDLIIQDELHLITGALGTSVGLFEAAVDVMCTWKDAEGREVRPLVIASSATVRNAPDQVHKLYARSTTMFPPQVLDASDTFFSHEKPCDRTTPGRRYIGLSTTGVRLSAAEIHTAETLLKGAQLLMDSADGGNAADPYMTLVAYFSTVRELAGMARFMQDDIGLHTKQGRVGSRLPRRFGTDAGNLRVGELTSRISSGDIVRTLNEMAASFDVEYDANLVGTPNKELDIKEPERKRRASEEARPFDAVLATSMLQVGVDVPRLGLMMIVGQPKNTAEYIQASSRVGRDAKRPGLVVTLGNWARPRDLAHYEQFKAYHESFYARVEPLSVTPFSVTSLDRGLDGLLVSAARVMDATRQNGLNPEMNAGRAAEEHQFLEHIVDLLSERIRNAGGEDASQEAISRLRNRIGVWETLANADNGDGKVLAYERVPKDDDRFDRLMRSAEQLAESDATMADRRFVVANSMREVQPEINILVSPDPNRLGYDDSDDAPQWQPQGVSAHNKKDEKDPNHE
ncbi:DISARM system helicase DrmA [Bifidobacterium castoris]|uniref:Helicase n=1 Tax=Bifidobacterium castoris TaxID=2306972 RepID=A0A430F6V2_9BIFI|nr:DISARM system helicase DrmA [Bifidobacterium castoris]RSX47932.1 helicase [Bifidobacterium castoris]